MKLLHFFTILFVSCTGVRSHVEDNPHHFFDSASSDATPRDASYGSGGPKPCDANPRGSSEGSEGSNPGDATPRGSSEGSEGSNPGDATPRGSSEGSEGSNPGDATPRGSSEGSEGSNPGDATPRGSSEGSDASPRDSRESSEGSKPSDATPRDGSDGSDATPRDSRESSEESKPSEPAPSGSSEGSGVSKPNDATPKDSKDDDDDSSEATRASRDSSSDIESPVRDIDPTSDGADSSGQAYAHNCDGEGVAYCKKPAVAETECPPMCVNCDEDRKTSLTAIAKSKLYDYVYIYGDKVCLSHCHGRTKCNDWDVYKGVRLCKSIRCRDEKGLEGCQKKSAFVVPSCLDCRLVFPRACTGEPLSSDSNDWGDSSEGWKGYRVYMKSAAPWDLETNTTSFNSTDVYYNKTFFNTSDWIETRTNNSTLRFRVVP